MLWISLLSHAVFGNPVPPIGSTPEDVLFGIMLLDLWWNMIFSENRFPPIGATPGGKICSGHALADHLP
jgi:hypothetical protein